MAKTYVLSEDQALDFEGFDKPEENYDRIPKWIIRNQRHFTEGELKTLLEIATETWGGWSDMGPEDYRFLTIPQIIDGRTGRDGKKITGGTGMSDAGQRAVCGRLEARGYIVIYRDQSDPARMKYAYRLRRKGEDKTSPDAPQQPPVKKKAPRPDTHWEIVVELARIAGVLVNGKPATGHSGAVHGAAKAIRTDGFGKKDLAMLVRYRDNGPNKWRWKDRPMTVGEIVKELPLAVQWAADNVETETVVDNDAILEALHG